MSELRIKLLDLAIRAGATIENATKVADDWERWATEDDPLRVDTPSPKCGDCEFCSHYCDEHGCLVKKEPVSTPAPIEIDWSRPQLVVSKYDDTMIVRTTGLHGFDEFEGFSSEDGDTPDWYKKKWFVYHGEIQKEPKEKTTGLNFLEAIRRACKAGKNIRTAGAWPNNMYWYCSNDAIFDSDGDRVDGIPVSDILATDWQIIEP